MNLLERVADKEHLVRVFSKVQSNRRFKPGIDGECIQDFAQELQCNLECLQGALLRNEYRFSPFVETAVPTFGGARVISRATLRDTIVQKALAMVVEPVLDPYIPDNCYAFRVGRQAPDINCAISVIVEHYRTRRYWVVKEDIRSYFESLDHAVIMGQLKELLPDPRIHSLYARYLEAPRAVDGQIQPRARGVPVGSILANFLSNLYLRPLDVEVKSDGYAYLRYCDDIIAFCESEEGAKRIRSTIAVFSSQLGLLLNQEKSMILPPGEPFVHLGYEFRGDAIRIGGKSLSKFKARVRRLTPRQSLNLTTRQGEVALRDLIARVNALIGGQYLSNWVRYFARCDFDDQFRELDLWIRDRVRAAATGRWNRGNYRLLPTGVLRGLGLRSTVREYYLWRGRWKERGKGLINQIADLDNLRSIVEAYRKRYWNAFEGRYDFLPGADGQTLEEFLDQERNNLRCLQELLLEGEYEFAPFIEYAKAKKGRTDERIICRSGLKDTVVQKATARELERRFDRRLNPNCYAYRPRRSQYAAFGKALRHMRELGEYWVVRADFNSFLDNIDLDIMARRVSELLAYEPLVLDLCLKYLYNPRCRDGELHLRTVGLPRGGILTPFFANLYLKPLDDELTALGFRYLRYADDVYVFAASEAGAESAYATVSQQAGRLGLSLSPEKSGIWAPNQEFECLGYRVLGREIRVRPYAVNRLKTRVRRLTRRHKSLVDLRDEDGRDRLRALIWRVNRAYIYRDGDWARHFCRATSEAEFRELDRWIADRIRACVTGRWSPKNRRLVPDSLLQELGLRKLLPRFYYWKRKVWRQGLTKRV